MTKYLRKYPTTRAFERKAYFRWCEFSYSRHQWWVRENVNPYCFMIEHIYKGQLGFYWKITISY